MLYKLVMAYICERDRKLNRIGICTIVSTDQFYA